MSRMHMGFISDEHRLFAHVRAVAVCVCVCVCVCVNESWDIYE